MLSGRLLLDVGPAAGGHGARGIGSYVRGLAEAVTAEWPSERTDLIWAVGPPCLTLERFANRGLSRSSLAWRPFDVGVVLARLAIGSAARRSRATVLHAMDPHRPWLPGRISRIITAYDLIPIREPEITAAWRPHDRLVYRWYLKQLVEADAIVAISRATADDLVGLLGIAADRIHVVYPSVRPGPTLARVEPSEPTFLFVGALDVHKQPDLAVRALAIFRQAHGAGQLRFVGPSSPTERRRLLVLAERLGVGPSIHLEGRVSNEALEAAYAGATAVLAPSRVEGFGLPAVEAAIRGVPVIAVEGAATRETLTGAATLTPSDPEAVATAMAAPSAPGPARAEALRDRFSARTAAEALWTVYAPFLG